MDRVLLRDLTVTGIKVESLQVFKDDSGKIIYLPLLWCIQLSVLGVTHKWVNVDRTWKPHSINNVSSPFNAEQELVTVDIKKSTIEKYAGHIYQFLLHVNISSKAGDSYSLDNLEVLSHDFLNSYVNEILPKQVSSFSALNSHVSALKSFFSFLSYLGLRRYTLIAIHRSTKQNLAKDDNSRKKISYISKSERSSLLLACSNQRDKLILRMGYEVGLRTSENRALVMANFNAKNSKHSGLTDLFDQLDKYPRRDRFSFLLNGRYTKGGRSRYVYFDRQLLLDMKRYFDTERQTLLQHYQLNSNSFFIRYDKEGAGSEISSNLGTRLFNKLRKQCFPDSQATYHDLRHTFASELYYSELLDSNNRETRSENAARIVVAERLGHRDIKTTLIYIRLLQHLKLIEGLEHD